MFLAETLPDIGFKTLSLMNSKYPSTIWEKSSVSYAHALAKNSVSERYNAFALVKFQEIVFHTLCLMSSTYSSRI
jgi:hypothetical protein